MNVELLRQVQDAISNRPKEFDMFMWRAIDYSSSTNCKTTFCIGGWAQVLSGIPENEINSNGQLKSQNLLDLTDAQAYELFYASKWPAKFSNDINPTAKQAIKFIDYFITKHTPKEA